MQIDRLRERYLVDATETVTRSEFYREQGKSDDEIRKIWKRLTGGMIPYDAWLKVKTKKMKKTEDVGWKKPTAIQLAKQRSRENVARAMEEYRNMTPEQKRKHDAAMQNKRDAYRANVMRLFSKTH